MQDPFYTSFITSLSQFMLNVNKSPPASNLTSLTETDTLLGLPIETLDQLLIKQNKPEKTSQENQTEKPKKHTSKKSKASIENCPDDSRCQDKFPWAEPDDFILVKVATMYYNDWKKIRNRIWRLRGKKMCINYLKSKFKSIKSKEATEKKGHFSHEEDLQLIEAIGKHGTDWGYLANIFEGRDQTMLKNRYYYLRKKKRIEDLVQESGKLTTKTT